MNLFNTSMIAALIAAIAAPAAAATGDGTFDAFQKVCGETHGDYAAVEAAASASGWKPSNVPAPPMSGVTFAAQLSRTTAADGGEITLIATRGKTGSGINVSTCTVYGQQQGFAELQSRAGKWLGFAPHDSGAQQSSFHFSSDGGKLKAVADADSDAAAAGPGLDILNVKVDSGKAILDLINIKK